MFFLDPIVIFSIKLKRDRLKSNMLCTAAWKKYSMAQFAFYYAPKTSVEYLMQ